MSRWEKVCLDKVCSKKIETISSTDEINIDYVDIPSVDNQEKKITSFQTLYSKEAPSRAKQVLRKNDILVSTVRPNLNAVAINTLESENVIVGSTGYCVLRCNENIEPSYLFNFCKSKPFVNSLVKVAKGASYPAVSNSDVRNCKIPLPPLETQMQIAKTLDTAAELLNLRKQQLAELDNLIKSTFYDMFGDPVTNEKGWDHRKVGSLLKESPQNGLYKPASDYTNDNSGIPILRIDSFYDGQLKQPLILKRLKCTEKEIDTYILQENNVVINRVNSIEYLGKCALISGLSEKTVFESNMMRLVICESIINSMYLTKFLCTPYIYNQILSHAKKAVNQASINQKDVQDFDISVPPLPFKPDSPKSLPKSRSKKPL